MIVDKIKKSDLCEILDIAKNFIDFDYDSAIDLAYSSLNTNANSIENIWYNSIKQNNPDYSIYNGIEYLCNTWYCWKTYSRRYLKTICNIKSLQNKSIVNDIGNITGIIIDTGCGFGYSTLALQEIFPNATVMGTNIEDSLQTKIARTLNVPIISDLNKLPNNVDLIFASEYFEHFYQPVLHLTELLNKCTPKNILIANSFNSVSSGHFPEYLYNNEIIINRKMGKIFNNCLREFKYKKVKTTNWNDRPAYWKKEV